MSHHRREPAQAAEALSVFQLAAELLPLADVTKRDHRAMVLLVVPERCNRDLRGDDFPARMNERGREASTLALCECRRQLARAIAPGAVEEPVQVRAGDGAGLVTEVLEGGVVRERAVPGGVDGEDAVVSRLQDHLQLAGELLPLFRLDLELPGALHHFRFQAAIQRLELAARELHAVHHRVERMREIRDLRVSLRPDAAREISGADCVRSVGDVPQGPRDDEADGEGGGQGEGEHDRDETGGRLPAGANARVDAGERHRDLELSDALRGIRHGDRDRERVVRTSAGGLDHVADEDRARGVAHHHALELGLVGESGQPLVCSARVVEEQGRADAERGQLGHARSFRARGEIRLGAKALRDIDDQDDGDRRDQQRDQRGQLHGEPDA